MNRSTRSRWINAAAFVAIAGLQVALSQPTFVSRWLIPGVMLAMAVWLSPLFKSSDRAVTHTEALQLLNDAEPGQRPVIIYHRPGCTYCGRLKLALSGVRSKAYWVDVWADPEASDFVKSVNNGNEVVPTVLIDGAPHTNPPPTDVRTALSTTS